MPRYMSFSFMIDLIKGKTKTVTRRLGWWFLRPGDELIAVEQSMWLKKGQKPVKVCKIRVTSTGPEPFHEITFDDVTLEGYVEMNTDEFVKLYCEMNKCDPDTMVNRIEFTYAED